jgi:hypothetical protein
MNHDIILIFLVEKSRMSLRTPAGRGQGIAVIPVELEQPDPLFQELKSS